MTALPAVDTGGPIGRSVGEVDDGYAATGVAQDVTRVQAIIVFDGRGGWSVLTSYPAI